VPNKKCNSKSLKDLAAILKMPPPRVDGAPCPVGELNLSAHARHALQLYLNHSNHSTAALI